MGRNQTQDAVRFCRFCGRPLQRKRFSGRLEDRQAFRRRQTCGRFCGWTESEALSQSVDHEVLETLRCEEKSLRERIENACKKAIARLEKLLDSKSEGIVLKAADSILDRCAETARNRRIEGDMHARYRIDPVTLMLAATVARELDGAAHGRLASGVEEDVSASSRTLPEASTTLALIQDLERSRRTTERKSAAVCERFETELCGIG